MAARTGTIFRLHACTCAFRRTGQAARDWSLMDFEKKPAVEPAGQGRQVQQ